MGCWLLVDGTGRPQAGVQAALVGRPDPLVQCQSCTAAAVHSGRPLCTLVVADMRADQSEDTSWEDTRAGDLDGLPVVKLRPRVPALAAVVPGIATG